MRRLLFALAVSLVTVACGASPAENSTTPQASTPPPAPASCDPGTMPSLESGACDAVGPTACPAGFTSADGGWGCSAIVPAAACTGATRATLGKTECVPVDDCSAPFPPANAILVHDSTELAAAIAKSDPGVTIALEAGTYGTITTDQDVTLVGRCASKVIVKGPGEHGIFIQQDRKVTLRSMTITGFTGGIVASYYNPHVEASHLVLSQNQIGIVAGEAFVHLSESAIEGHPAAMGSTPDDSAVNVEIGAKVTLDDVDVRDTASAFVAFDAPGAVEVHRSVVRYDGPSRTAHLVQAYRGGAVTITESSVHMRESGFATLGKDLPGLPPVKDPKAGSLHVVASEVVQTGSDRSDRELILSGAGSTIAVDGSTLVHQSAILFLAGEPATSVALTDSVIRAIPTSGLSRTAVMVLHGATAKLTRTAVVEAYQNALAAGHQGATLTLDHSLVTGTKFGGAGPNAELGGVGVGIGAGDGASLSVTDSAIVGSEQFGILADTGARLVVSRSIVDATSTTSAEVSGIGIAINGGAQLAMDASMVRGSGDAALMFVASQGIVQGSRFTANKVGVHLEGTSLVEAKEPPMAGDAEQAVFFANVFENNETYSLTLPVQIPPFTTR